MADRPMNRDAPFYIYRNAKLLRQNATEPEKKLWLYLRERPLGFKFRRQHPLAVYIADFYCHKANLVIEVDGMIHTEPEVLDYDEHREHCFQKMNLTTLRFTNEEVLNDFDIVAEKILAVLKNYESGSNKESTG